ncbi:amino acid adenylation domain-containing protein [Microbulbifer sp. 2304DJ12-6]|uniref:amino acid adenylation domain-containing protein n=1 Tax=Microbulbifer sp. 2304DJ12-6 TaxID=3233340 RepID=UPI0039AED76B
MNATLNLAEGAERYALSSQQKRIWALNGEDRQYCCFSLTRLTGDVDHRRLQQALDILTMRHEVMRTWFEKPGGTKFPFQKVAAHWPVALRVSDVEASEGLEALLAAQWTAQTVDCLIQPHSQCHLYHCSSGVSYLVLALPMLCVDRSGVNLLTDELLRLYRDSFDPDEEALQFLDVIDELDEQHGAPEAERLLETIRNSETHGNRAGRIFLTETSPVDDEAKPWMARVARIRLVVGLSESLAAFSRDHRWHNRSLLFSLWQHLLNRMSREPVPIGVVFDGRLDPELAQLPGTLSRAIPAGVGGGDDQTLISFVALVEQLLGELERMQEHFDWQSLVDEQEPLLARYGFSFGRTEDPACCYVGGAMEPFELSLCCTVQQSDLLLDFEYDKLLFSEQAVSLLADRFSAMLEQALAGLTHDTTMRVGEVDAIGEAQRRVLANTITPALIDTTEPVHEVFERHAAATPDAIALETEAGEFSFAEIHEESEALAAYLQSLGIESGMPVAVCTERDKYLVVSLLAILKIGAIYVPLDPQLVGQRMEYIVGDTGCQWILTVSLLSDDVKGLGTRVMLDQLKLSDHSFTPVDVASEQLAYLIYTSGSTGEPKGVSISHRALVQYVTGVEARLKLGEDASMLSLASVATDLGHTALFGALLTGRTLRLLSADKAMNADALVDQLRDNPVSCLKVVPSHLRALLTAQEPAFLLPTETLVIGGEALTEDLIEKVRALKPDLRIVNHYGPTETTVGIITHEVIEYESACPIGRPLAGACAHVVNERGGLAGIGEVGELYLGGVTIAEGYWQRQELTDERFVPDTFSQEKDLRLYRSGDLAHYRADGELVYMGRGDDQVKIRGFRVELSEVEKSLCRHPEVVQAVVVLQASEFESAGDSNPHQDLVAHLVMASAQELDVEAVQAFMHQELPDYMVPVAMQSIRTLPLTQSGKVDRKALPRVERHWGRKANYVSPRNQLEQGLVKLWQELLAIPQVGIHDEFFALGGHSLLVTQHMSYVRKHYHLELPIKSFFDAPTIAEQSGLISHLLEKQPTVAGEVGDIAACDAASLLTLPLSFGQERLWFTQQMNDVQKGLYNTPHVWRLEGPLDAHRLSCAFSQIVERHQILRTGYRVKDGELSQYIADFKFQPIKVHDRCDQFASLDEALSKGSALVAEIMTLIGQEFDLSECSLYSIDLFRVAPEQHVLVFNLHHIVSDGWSLGIFQHELSEFYRTQNCNAASEIAPLQYQYTDYAIWQREMYQQGKWDHQVQYWRANLSGLPELRYPPVGNKPSGGEDALESGTHKFQFDQTMTEALRTAARDNQVTQFMLNLALVKLVVGHHCGQQDFAIGTSTAGRNRQEFNQLIGFFVNQLVLRIDARPDMALTEFLGEVKETTLGAYEHHDIPFSLLVSELAHDRQPGQQPFFNCLFLFQEFPEKPLTIDGLSIDSWGSEDYDAKFALTLYMGYEDGVLSGTWVYNKQWFSDQAVEKLTAYYKRVAEQLVGDTSLKLEQLTYATEKELAEEAAARRISKMQKFSRVKRPIRKLPKP